MAHIPDAKTLLTIAPGHPWINFALAAAMLFFTVSKDCADLNVFGVNNALYCR
jgi:hypothetical protein